MIFQMRMKKTYALKKNPNQSISKKINILIKVY